MSRGWFTSSWFVLEVLMAITTRHRHMMVQKGSEVKSMIVAQLKRLSKCKEVRSDSKRKLKSHQETRTAGQFDTSPAPLCLQ
uniref:Secreted protein n=1 Tax=Arundo donax TaxID=35708 RepID=A0A0A9DFS3_ARUDO